MDEEIDGRAAPRPIGRLRQWWTDGSHVGPVPGHLGGLGSHPVRPFRSLLDPGPDHRDRRFVEGIGVGRHRGRPVHRLAAGAVKDGMVIGFGTGRAAEAVLTILARRVYEGLKVSGIPTSIATEAHARALGLPLTDLSAHPSLDLTIDGSDEVDPARNLIKGGGAALFREKVLAAASDRLIVVVDSTKLVTRLGSTRGIPVEVLPFATGACIRQIAEMGGEAIVRTKNESPVVTDNGNWVLDVTFDAEAMANPRALDTAMRAIPGVIITGLFWSFDATVVVGTQGGTEILGPPL